MTKIATLSRYPLASRPTNAPFRIRGRVSTSAAKRFQRLTVGTVFFDLTCGGPFTTRRKSTSTQTTKNVNFHIPYVGLRIYASSSGYGPAIMFIFNGIYGNKKSCKWHMLCLEGNFSPFVTTRRIQLRAV